MKTTESSIYLLCTCLGNLQTSKYHPQSFLFSKLRSFKLFSQCSYFKKIALINLSVLYCTFLGFLRWEARAAFSCKYNEARIFSGFFTISFLIRSNIFFVFLVTTAIYQKSFHLHDHLCVRQESMLLPSFIIHAAVFLLLTV